MWITALQQGEWWCPMCDGHGRWGMMGMWLFWLVVIVALVFGVAALLRSGRREARSVVPSPPETPVETLRRRYAAGEIDRESYQQMLDDLGESNP